ncbi:jg18928 [Pararge aegeria aegeria]|uniref:Jg18928 protein n=1 Tax=Pararge aegeria aegeria TaxID=348720 RepID=A0A8S4QR65_9NEOP|nr:jg18928 [Pararge aegeria aegeria]
MHSVKGRTGDPSQQIINSLHQTNAELKASNNGGFAHNHHAGDGLVIAVDLVAAQRTLLSVLRYIPLIASYDYDTREKRRGGDNSLF